MLSLSVVALVAGVVTAVLAVSINEDGFYDTRYNHLDVERILNNKRLVMYYGQCLMGEGPCTPQGTEFKRILPEALRTNCIRCTEKQKVTAYLAIRRLKKEYPKIWQQLQVEWDPKGEYVSAFINTVESSTGSAPASTPGAQPGAQPASTEPGAIPNIITRFGAAAGAYPAENEITAEAPAAVPLIADIPPSTSARIVASSPSTTSTTTTTTARTTTTSTARSTAAVTEAAPTVAATVAATVTQTAAATPRPATSNVRPPSTEINYRTSYRPTRFNILLPRPQDFGRFTVNLVGSIGDIGSKVIRTGARIADMVLSGVQAGVQATIGRPLQ